MRLSCLMLLAVLCAAAQAEDGKKDPYLDAPASIPEVKALQGRADPAVQKAIASAMAAEVPPPPMFQSVPAFSSTKVDTMTIAFREAKIPDCLHADGLKFQPTFIFTGLLALPFIPIAALRGKCH
jgi:hypothetical protein